MVRGVVTLPAGTGKTVRVAVFAKRRQGRRGDGGGRRRRRRRGPDGDHPGRQRSTSTACIATPDMMGVVGRLGKVLGPKGLMPNPKLGTVTPNVAEAVKAAKGGQVEFRVEKAGHHPLRHRQGELPERGPAPEFRRVRRRDRQGQADRRQGQVCQEGRAQLVDGPGPQGRHGGSRFRLIISVSRRRPGPSLGTGLRR